MTDAVHCLYCTEPAQVTITSEWRGRLAHWPTCLVHMEAVTARVRQQVAGVDELRPLPSPDLRQDHVVVDGTVEG